MIVVLMLNWVNIIFFYDFGLGLIYFLGLNLVWLIIDSIKKFYFIIMQYDVNNFSFTLDSSRIFGIFVSNLKFRYSCYLTFLYFFWFNFPMLIFNFETLWSFILFIYQSYFFFDIPLNFLNLKVISLYFFMILDTELSIFIFIVEVIDFFVFMINIFV